MFYVLDEQHNLHEAFDKQGVLNAIETAIADGSLANLVADAAFVNKLKCCVGGDTFRVAFVTQAKYNELQATHSLVSNCLYYITDETTADDLDEALTLLNNTVNELGSTINGINNTVNELNKRAAVMLDENGVLYCPVVETVDLHNDGKDSSYDDRALYAVEIRNGYLIDGEELDYNGETLTVSGNDNDGWQIAASINGEFATTSGKVATVTRKKKVIIPQKHLLWSGNKTITSNEIFITSCKAYIGKKVEIHYSYEIIYSTQKRKIDAVGRAVIKEGEKISGSYLGQIACFDFITQDSIPSNYLEVCTFRLDEQNNLYAKTSDGNVELTAIYEVIE